MATRNTTGRAGYMYEASTQTWWQISGRVPTAANYIWTGTHQFNNEVRVAGNLNATARMNCFLNPAARSAIITAPQVGLITFIQQDSNGNTVNRFECWNGTTWTIIDADRKALITPVNGPYTLATSLLDAGTTIEQTSTNPTTFTVPNDSTVTYPAGSQISIVQTGTGQITVTPAIGVTINGTPGLKTRTQWSMITLTKRTTTNSWLVTGDSAA